MTEKRQKSCIIYGCVWQQPQPASCLNCEVWLYNEIDDNIVYKEMVLLCVILIVCTNQKPYWLISG